MEDEVKWVDGQPKNQKFFEQRMEVTFREGRQVLREDGIGSVVFAHKTTEGWEALLSGLISGGWAVTGSWPIATEMAHRPRARDSAALATSVHLVCRPRSEDAPVGDWADVLRELPRRVGDWMERLQGEGIRGADLVFACIGPALEIFSRYRTVETAEGREVGLPEYLEKVWEVVGRAASATGARHGGSAGAQRSGGRAGRRRPPDGAVPVDIAEHGNSAGWKPALPGQDAGRQLDALRTDDEDEEAVAKAAAKGFSLPFDVVRRFAQPMGIDLDRWTGRIIGQHKGLVRLLPVGERAGDLFGKDGARSAAEWIESDPGAGLQQSLFPDWDDRDRSRSDAERGKKSILDRDAELQSTDATVLDRVHAAMLLQSSGHTNALRALIAAEQDRGPDFLRLANALSALYPRSSQEKRLLDAMLLAAPR